LWVCIVDGADSFRRFLVDMKPKTPAAGFHSDLDKFIDYLDDLSIHGSATRTEEESAFRGRTNPLELFQHKCASVTP
jgi:hypothetical protein